MKPRILYDNNFTDGIVTASTTAALPFHADNLWDWRPYTWWKPTALPATVTVDCLTAQAADYWFVYGHDLFTQAATIELRGSTDNFAASNVLVDTLTPISNAAFARTFTSTSFRYWRIRITGTTMPSLAIVAAGVKLEPDGFLSVDFDPLSRSSVTRTNRNENGQPLGKVTQFVEWSQAVTFRRTSWTWIRATFLPAWRAHLRATPFGWQWNAGVDAEPYLVTAGDDLRLPHYQAAQADVSFDLTAVVE